MSRRKVDGSRDPGGFVALPHSVLDSAAYSGLSATAKALLVEIARQHGPGRNGRLIATPRYMATRGWKSHGLITRAVRELIAAGLLYQTVKGHRPNKASWFALTWYSLDKHAGYDPGAMGAYRRAPYRDLAAEIGRQKNRRLIPSKRTKRLSIVPAEGIRNAAAIPTEGTMRGRFDNLSIPSTGNHLDIAICGAAQRGASAARMRALAERLWSDMPTDVLEVA